MKVITFEPVMDGRKRKLHVIEKVNGYKHTETDGIHCFIRGNITYMIDMTKEEATIKKFDYLTTSYKDLSYEEFHKFLKIEAL